MTRDYLVELLNAYWFAPPVALWRAVEIRAVAEAYGEVEHPLLDVGCGDGLIAEILRPAWGVVDVGFDPWAAPLRQAKACGAYDHIDRADGHAMPYADGTFATAFSNSVLEHIPDVQPVVEEVARVLQPGGRFIFTVPSAAFRRMLDGYARRAERGDGEGAEAYAAEVDERLEHHHYYTRHEWETLLARAGLTLREARTYMPEAAERFWDQMNGRYGIGRGRSMWSVLASPRLQALGYQGLLRRMVVNRLGERWRPYYEMDVEPGAEGGGLLVIAQR